MKLGPFKGMNNRAADHALPKGTKEDPRAAVRNAVNVNFDNAGKASLRWGMVKKYSGLGLAGGFCCSQGMFIVEAGSLRKVNVTGWASSVILTGITGTVFTFHEFNGVLYFSDGTKTAKIVNGVAGKWGMENPSTPVVYSVTGIFGAGVYRCCLTYVNAAGNESGASEIVSLTIDDNKGIVFTNIPHSQDPQVVSVRLYMTTANGKIFFQCGDVANGTHFYSVLLPYDSGKVIDALFMTRPPAGQIIREYNGRIYIAAGPLLYVSEAYSPDLFSQLSKNVFQVGADVTVMEPVDDGIWIVADKTYFMAGSGPEDFRQLTRLDYGAALGTGGKIPWSKDVTWFSKRGFIVAGNGGEIKNIQEDDVAPDYSDAGAILIREFDGKRQAIASLVAPEISTMASSSFCTMEVIRRAG